MSVTQRHHHPGVSCLPEDPVWILLDERAGDPVLSPPEGDPHVMQTEPAGTWGQARHSAELGGVRPVPTTTQQSSWELPAATAALGEALGQAWPPDSCCGDADVPPSYPAFRVTFTCSFEAWSRRPSPGRSWLHRPPPSPLPGGSVRPHTLLLPRLHPESHLLLPTLLPTLDSSPSFWNLPSLHPLCLLSPGLAWLCSLIA